MDIPVNQSWYFLGIFVAGSLAGSFFFTLAYRYIHNPGISYRELLLTRSRCPHCGKPVHPLFLVPVIGYLFTRTRCNACGTGISPMYPASELVSGLLALGAFHLWGQGLQAICLYLVVMSALTLTWIDIKTMTLPSVPMIIMAMAGLVLHGSTLSWKEPLMGALAMGTVFIIILLIFPGSFGGGDVKYAMVMGFVLELELVPVALEISLVSGALAGVIYALVSGKGLRSFMPFGPFMSLGLVISLLWGQEILLLYHNLFL